MEGASEVHPLSVAKVFAIFYAPSPNTSLCCPTKTIVLPSEQHVSWNSFSLQVTLDDQKSKAVEFKIIWSSSPDCLKYESYFSLPELIEFPTEVPGQTAFAYFYPPSNPSYQATKDEKPPLLLKSHGMYSLEFS